MTKLMMFAAVAAVAMGCQKSDLDKNGNTQTQGIPVTISAGVDDTKTTHIGYDDPNPANGNKMAFHWTPSDQISLSVFGMTANKNCQFTTESDQKTGVFTGSVGASWSEEKTLFAVFPYDADGYSTSELGGKPSLKIRLPAVQAYTVGGNLSNSIMVATAKATSPTTIPALTFKQKTAIIRLNITGIPARKKVTKVELACESSVLPSDYIIFEDDAYSRVETPVKGFTTTVANAIAGANTRVDIVVLPDLKGEVAGKKITLKVTVSDGSGDGTKDEVKTIEKTAPAFAAGKHYGVDFEFTSIIRYIAVNGIKCAIGNLVANGDYGAKIGAGADNGLYFQFGSLVGWSETGDPTIVVRPVGYTGSGDWNPNWTGDPKTVNVATGTGDPCRYYLGGTWHLPTADEYKTMFNNVRNGNWENSGGWSWSSDSNWAIHTSDSKLPASGVRSDSNGYLSSIGAYGNYWSASPEGDSNGYSLNFLKPTVRPSVSRSQALGYPVRCVCD